MYLASKDSVNVIYVWKLLNRFFCRFPRSFEGLIFLFLVALLAIDWMNPSLPVSAEETIEFSSLAFPRFIDCLGPPWQVVLKGPSSSGVVFQKQTGDGSRFRSLISLKSLIREPTPPKLTLVSHLPILLGNWTCSRSTTLTLLLGRSPLSQNKKLSSFWSQYSAPCSYNSLRASVRQVSKSLSVSSWKLGILWAWSYREIPSMSERIRAGSPLKEPCP